MFSSNFVAACAVTLSWSLPCHSTPLSRNHTTKFQWDQTKYVVAFGDSYTYAQGTLGYANSTFIGSNLNFSFTPEQLLSDRIVQEDVNSTANRGPNWVEDITQCGVKEGLTDPQTCDIQLWDFAFGGADISVEYLPLHHNWSVQLVNQTQQFITYAQPVLKDIVDADETLVAMWIGINDINDSDKLNVDFPSFYEELITTMFAEAVEPVYKAGYKKWLFMKLPPLDRTPGNLVRAGGPLPNKTMIGWWDDTLEKHASDFAALNKDVTALVFDSNTFLNHVLDNPAEYDLKNVTSYCPSYDQPLPVTQYGCLPLEDYFWYNTGHMTTHVHAILAKEVERFLASCSH
ncbi:unnamed protein product [Discula destructiva]